MKSKKNSRAHLVNSDDNTIRRAFGMYILGFLTNGILYLAIYLACIFFPPANYSFVADLTGVIEGEKAHFWKTIILMLVLSVACDFIVIGLIGILAPRVFLIPYFFNRDRDFNACLEEIPTVITGICFALIIWATIIILSIS